MRKAQLWASRLGLSLPILFGLGGPGVEVASEGDRRIQVTKGLHEPDSRRAGADLAVRVALRAIRWDSDSDIMIQLEGRTEFLRFADGALDALAEMPAPIVCNARVLGGNAVVACRSISGQVAIDRHLREVRLLLAPSSTVGALLATAERTGTDPRVLVRMPAYSRLLPLSAIHDWLLKFALPIGLSISRTEPTASQSKAGAIAVLTIE